MLFPITAPPELQADARALASTHGLTFLPEISEETAHALVLDPTGLNLWARGMKPISVDFQQGALARRGKQGGEMLHRAVGLKKGRRPSVVDATAGLGRDGFLLATMGCEVTWLERSPVIAALLADGLRRTALTNPRLIQVDAREWLAQSAPEVVYLDPMFPHRDKSALVKKEMRVFREVVGEDGDAAELLTLARRVATRRVVVKRPKLAPWLGESQPDESLRGNATRFDLYFA